MNSLSFRTYNCFNVLAIILGVATFCFFSDWVFFHNHLRFTGLQGKGEGISLMHHYNFHPPHRHLDISRAITAKSSPLHIGRLVFSRLFYICGNLGNVKEKPTRKTCFSREMKCLALCIYLAKFC